LPPDRPTISNSGYCGGGHVITQENAYAYIRENYFILLLLSQVVAELPPVWRIMEMDCQCHGELRDFV